MKKPYLLLLLIVAGIFHMKPTANAQESNKLPDISLTDMQGNKVDNSTLASRAGMFMYFDPLCDVCELEMKILKSHMSYFKDKPLYLVSPGKKEDVAHFIKEHKLDKYSYVTVIQDQDDQFYKLFKTGGYPSIYIFNAQNDVVGNFVGETYFEEIQAAFEGKQIPDMTAISTIDTKRAAPLMGF